MDLNIRCVVQEHSWGLRNRTWGMKLLVTAELAAEEGM